MNGIDTSLLLRTILNDDAGQVARVRALSASVGDLVVNDLVMAETVWNLQRSVGASSADIALALDRIMAGSDIRPLDGDILARARTDSAAHGFGLADGLIGARNAKAGCATTYTFDKRAARSDLFTMVP